MSTIHDALHLRNTSRLPPFFRRIALAAANGSLEDLSRVYAFIQNPLIPPQEADLLLPVVYVLLNPSLIPQGDTLDRIIITETILPSPIGCAAMALTILGALRRVSSIIQEISFDLWPRVWPWMQFLDTYLQYLPGWTAPGVQSAVLVHYPILLSFCDHPLTSSIVLATPGVRIVLTHGWMALLDTDTIATPEAAIDLVKTLSHDVADRTNFEEIISAVGGSYDNLTSLMLKHISLALSFPEPDMRVRLLTYILHFLQAAGVNEGFPPTLVSRKIITTLLSTLDALTNTTEILTGAGIIRGLAVLAGCLQIEPVYLRVTEAVRAGLLRVIISCAVKDIQMPGGDVPHELEWLVIRFLPRTLVFHGVVAAMRDSLSDTRTAAEIPEFKTTPLFPHWIALDRSVDDRVGVLNSWESAGRPWSAVCENTVCGAIKSMKGFNRCAGCESVLYCSSECQRADWRTSHREVCKLLLPHRPYSFDGRFPRRARAFVRALLDADHRRLKFQTSYDIVLFMHSHPDAPDAFFVQFDYTNGRASTSVFPRTELYLPVHHRVNQVHTMLVMLGRQEQRYLLPLRASSTAFTEGLSRIAGEIPAGANIILYRELVEHKLRALIQETEGRVIEIH
ncbi:MYND-type domain-containing protein [Mycena venus]|uniref:MYND-type domain-containing protein n=1 Tax=Mycena venus TaxID=2733690 RepID=A0A8H6XJ20_9AGAR|nr:MYND-type domain-containing protein [Mycena venus]